MFISGVNDTGDKLLGGANDTAPKFNTGVNDTAEQVSPLTTTLAIN